MVSAACDVKMEEPSDGASEVLAVTTVTSDGAGPNPR